MITQGKWIVMGNQRNGHFDYVLPMADDDDFQDNARLIAAAPELLEACKMGLKLAQMINHPDEYHIEQAIAAAENKV